ncbi:MAG: AAA family ATPase [Planctomycetes bacterium]|nr:AAA family ATPase [Planctomycetota bacterium]
MPRVQDFEHGFEQDIVEDARRFFESLPVYTPRQIFQKLNDLGYKGQEEARRAISLMAYRHIRRIRRIHIEGVSRSLLPPKSNVLLMGPTGCGKTFLVELLFNDVLRLPTAMIDISGYSETGYVGDDVKTILTRLIHAAGGNPIIASVGVVCLDEFDKLASSQNTARFDGQGTTKDVSGLGVQKELLRMLEAATVDVPTDYNNTIYSDRVRIFTGDVPFIACGAFSGFKNTALVRSGTPFIGFRGTRDPADRERIAVALEAAEINNIENFHCYGFLPELVARFTRVVALQPLDRSTLKSILVDNVIRSFKHEFQSEGLELQVEAKVLNHIVDLSLDRQTGARGLNALLTQYIERAAYDQFGDGKNDAIRLCMRRGEIQTQRLRRR